MAWRRGLSLTKSRRRDPGGLDFGKYWLLSWDPKAIVVGGDWGVSLSEVASYLGETEASPVPARP